MTAQAPAAHLIEAAQQARTHAHAPYSRFHVGAVLALADGSVITGANFENVSLGLSLCAEAVAIAAANAQGRLAQAVALVVLGGPDTDDPQPVMPCGRCRQMLVEAQLIASTPLAVYCADEQGAAWKRWRVQDLLPHAFAPDILRPAPPQSDRKE